MQLLKLRYLQIKRDLGYWIFPILVLIFFISKEVSEPSYLYGLSLSAIYLFFLYSYHVNRKDLIFIKHYLKNPQRNVSINYNLLALSASLALITNGQILIALGLHLCVTLLVLIRIESESPSLLFVAKYIPASQFEWISGVRKNFFLLLILFLASVFLSPVKFFGPVSLFLMSSIFLSFYSYFEPLAMLNPSNEDAGHFLKQKTDFFIKALLCLNTPLLFINSVFHPDILWFNLCLLVGLTMLASFSIYIKYSSYKPNQQLTFHIDYLFFYVAALIPFLLPIAIFLNNSHKKRAIQNLLIYTDDKS